MLPLLKLPAHPIDPALQKTVVVFIFIIIVPKNLPLIFYSTIILPYSKLSKLAVRLYFYPLSATTQQMYTAYTYAHNSLHGATGVKTAGQLITLLKISRRFCSKWFGQGICSVSHCFFI